jgi:hypothetical protein
VTGRLIIRDFSPFSSHSSGPPAVRANVRSVASVEEVIAVPAVQGVVPTLTAEESVPSPPSRASLPLLATMESPPSRPKMVSAAADPSIHPLRSLVPNSP